MHVAVVILNFNRKAETLECLKSLSQLDGTVKPELVVVDNASTDGSVQSIKGEYPDCTILVNPENLGFAEGNNVGIKYCLNQKAQYVLILNNDTTLDSHCIEELLDFASVDKKGGIFGPKIYFSPGKETHLSRYKKGDIGRVLWYAGGRIDWDNMLASHRGVDEVDSPFYSINQKTQFVSGCAMFVHRHIYEKIGLFDRRFYLYFEDVDFCLKATRKGFGIWYVPKAVVWHKNAESSGGTGSDLQMYYMTRNRLLIGMRYAPWRTKLALMREAMNLIIKGDKTQKQAVGDYLRRRYGKRK